MYTLLYYPNLFYIYYLTYTICYATHCILYGINVSLTIHNTVPSFQAKGLATMMPMNAVALAAGKNIHLEPRHFPWVYTGCVGLIVSMGLIQVFVLSIWV